MWVTAGVYKWERRVASGVDLLWMLLSSASAAPPLPTTAAMAYRHTGKTLSVRGPRCPSRYASSSGEL